MKRTLKHLISLLLLLIDLTSLIADSAMQPFEPIGYFGREKELEWRMEQTVGYADVPKASFLMRTFMQLAVSPRPAWQSEIGVSLAISRAWEGGWEKGLFLLRHLLFEDLLPNPIDMGVEGLVRLISSHALGDPWSLVRGRYELEVGLFVSKEIAFLEHPCWRFASACYLGAADRGSGWMRLQLEISRWLALTHRFDLFWEFGYGFGVKKFCPNRHQGFGSLAYRYCDAALRYHLLLFRGYGIVFQLWERLYGDQLIRHDHGIGCEFILYSGI